MDDDKPKVRLTLDGVAETPEVRAWLDACERVLNAHDAATKALAARDAIKIYGAAVVSLDDLRPQIVEKKL